MKSDDDLLRFDGLAEMFSAMRRPTYHELNGFLRRLIDSDWESADEAFSLVELDSASAGNTLVCDQTRIFLQDIVEHDGVELTPNRWLKLKVVKRLMEKMAWAQQDFEIGGGHRVIKRPGEQSIKPIGIIRNVCETVGLVRTRRGRLYVPRRVLPLLADENAGRLHRELFMALFRVADNSFLWDRYNEMPLLQGSLAVILWRLQSVAADWISTDDLPEEVLLEQVLDELRAGWCFPGYVSITLFHRVLAPLVWFGLMERNPPVPKLLESKVLVRKTVLFDRFFRFDRFPPVGPVVAS